MCPPYPQRDRKRRLNGAVSRNNRIKGWSRVGARMGMLKNPTKCLWRWEPDRRSNFFSPPAHLCAVTYMTEISLIVTFNNQLTYPNLKCIYTFACGPMNLTGLKDLWTLDRGRPPSKAEKLKYLLYTQLFAKLEEILCVLTLQYYLHLNFHSFRWDNL